MLTTTLDTFFPWFDENDFLSTYDIFDKFCNYTTDIDAPRLTPFRYVMHFDAVRATYSSMRRDSSSLSLLGGLDATNIVPKAMSGLLKVHI